MKATIFLLIVAIMPVRAMAQEPETIPTLPALPVIIDTLPQLPDPTPVPAFPPREERDMRFVPRNDKELPVVRDVPVRPLQPERSNSLADKAPTEPQPQTPSTSPPLSFLPESPPAKMAPGFGQLAVSLPDPSRRSFRPTEQHSGPISDVEIAAATIKADEANIDRRRAAVRYLAGIDCTFNPEAETGLLTALRSDRNESVRYEAAVALSNNCCWTRKTIEALNQALIGGSADGCPSERSDRVRWASWQALSRYAAAINPQQQPKELPAAVSTPLIRRTAGDGPITTHSTSCFFPPGPATVGKSGSARNGDVGPLPPLRPIAAVPEVEPQAPTYEPTPMQNTFKR
jgi:hypothetical protein